MASKAASQPVYPIDRQTSDRALVDAFVARHFGFRGTLCLHRHALGWDLLPGAADWRDPSPDVGRRYCLQCGGTDRTPSGMTP